MTTAAMAAARATDPGTSHEAAAVAPRARHRRALLEALAVGPAGATELADRCGLDAHQVSKRLPELSRLGMATTGGVVVNRKGRRERVWRLTYGT